MTGKQKTQGHRVKTSDSRPQGTNNACVCAFLSLLAPEPWRTRASSYQILKVDLSRCAMSSSPSTLSRDYV